MNKKDGKIILLVEDNSTTAFIEKNIIEKYGYTVICANSGEAAVEMAEKTPDIDLVLMDIDLGKGMDGTMAASLILKKLDVPLIFLSSHEEREVIENTQTISSYGYVVKDSGEMALIVSIRTAFRLFDSLLKEKEYQAFRSRVFEKSTLPIVVMDAENYRYIDCNPAAAAAYGYSCVEDILGKTPLDVSAPVQYDGTPSSEKAAHFINMALSKGCVVFEWRHRRPDGVNWDAEVHLMHFTSGNKNYLQFTLIDITVRRERYSADILKFFSPSKLLV